MFLERQAFVKIGKFDENFFLYYEDQDLINRFIKANNDVYKIPLYFNHLGRSHDKKFNHSVELNRHWHYLWSRIYFIKKNNGYLAAFCLAMPVLTRSACKYVFFHFFNKEKSLIYKMRMLGAINSLLNKKSWYRPNM